MWSKRAVGSSYSGQSRFPLYRKQGIRFTLNKYANISWSVTTSLISPEIISSMGTQCFTGNPIGKFRHLNTHSLLHHKHPIC